MFTIPTALATHMAQDVATLAFAVKITPVGLSALAFTTAPIDCTVNGTVFPASNSVTVASFTSQLGLVPGRVDVSGPFDSAGITEVGCHAGLYDFAAVEIYCFNWQDVTMGYWTPMKGHVSDISIDGREWTFEVSDLLDLFSQSIVELTSATCRVELFSTRCKVPSSVPVWQASTTCTAGPDTDAGVGTWMRPTVNNRRWYYCIDSGPTGVTEPTWNTTVNGLTFDGGADRWTTRIALVQSGTVTAKTSNQTFADSSITETGDFWKYGKVQWVTGANAGISMEIKTHTATVLELFAAMPYTIQVGDTFTLYAGCAKTKAACIAHHNLRNMQAEPDKPSSKLLTQFGAR